MFPHRMMACVDGPSGLAIAQTELAWLARHFKCPLVIFHSIEPWTDSASDQRGGLTGELIDAVADGPLFEGLDVRVIKHAETRNLVPAILETADHVDADLLVLPVRRRKGLERVMRRDAAEELVKSCRVPILTLDSERAPEALDAPAFDLVVAPIDFSPPSGQALLLAARVAENLGAPMVLLHALPDIPFTLTHEVTDTEIKDWMLKSTLEKISDEAAKFVPDTVSWTSSAPIATVLEAVAAVTAAARNPLIVMSTAGRDSIGDRILGSRTERVFRAGAGSVLILPPPALDLIVPRFVNREASSNLEA